MRSIVYMHLLLAVISLAIVSPVAAQESDPAVRIAIDQPTADLWRLHFPASKLDVLVRSDDESYDTLNRRALSLRDATHVLYRSDQSSLISQFFRERISNQGVQSLDLAEHFRLRERESESDGNSGQRRIARQRIGDFQTERSAKNPLPSEQEAKRFLALSVSLEQ